MPLAFSDLSLNEQLEISDTIKPIENILNNFDNATKQEKLELFSLVQKLNDVILNIPDINLSNLKINGSYITYNFYKKLMLFSLETSLQVFEWDDFATKYGNKTTYDYGRQKYFPRRFNFATSELVPIYQRALFYKISELACQQTSLKSNSDIYTMLDVLFNYVSGFGYANHSVFEKQISNHLLDKLNLFIYDKSNIIYGKFSDTLINLEHQHYVDGFDKLDIRMFQSLFETTIFKAKAKVKSL